MGLKDFRAVDRAQWMALAAALLGWMFDGLEQGLFPLAARPALRELLVNTQEQDVGRWFAIGTACFLIGAATGGVLFGWLGDRIGRVRAMTLSVLTYAVFSGLCAFVTTAHQIVALRFLSALGMGGEWSLGVALVMEVWPDRSRSLLAGLIGASANAGYLLLSLIGAGLTTALMQVGSGLRRVGFPDPWVDALIRNDGWRLLMLLGLLPALLTFFIRLFVPESERWQQHQGKGTTTHWATRDLLGVLFGSAAGCGIIYLWSDDSLGLPVQIAGTLAAVLLVTLGYLYPLVRYLQRSASNAGASATSLGPTVRRMLLGACLGGVPLLVTWSAMQWASLWADQLIGGRFPNAKAYTQACSAMGAIIGTILGAMLGDWIGRRWAYSTLCLLSLGSALFFFQGNHEYGPQFLLSIFVAGGCTATFYGWLPLYLPELYGTRIRATGQGFSYNFGRILAAIGVLQTGNLMSIFKDNFGDRAYPNACSIMSLIYVVGLVIIWLAPETRGKPLPE
jgi:MFS family permease